MNKLFADRTVSFVKAHDTLFSVSMIFLLSFLVRLYAFMQTPFANGWDSYFYLVQVKSLLEEGYMHSRDLSIIYPLMIGIQLLVKDYELAYKVTAALLAAGFSITMYFLAIKISGEKHIAWLIASYTIFSPHLTYFASQYPKNLLGVLLFLCLLISLKNHKPWWSLLLLLLNFFGHRLTAVLAVIATGLYILIKKNARIGLIVVGVTLLLFLGAGLLLDGLLSFADAERFNGAFSSHLQFSPYSFIQSFNSLLSPLWLLEVLFLSLVFLVSMVPFFMSILNKNLNPLLACLVIISVVLLFPFFTWDLESIGYRFFLVFMLITPLLLIYFENLLVNYKLVLPLITIFIIASPFSLEAYNPARLDPPYNLYKKMADKIVSQYSKKDMELIIAHKSLAEYITFQTGIDAMPWVPEYTIAEDKLWRIATGISEQEVRYYLNDSSASIIKLSPNYFLIKEKDWALLINKLTENNENELLLYLNSWKNPSKKRPYYLLKNKK